MECTFCGKEVEKLVDGDWCEECWDDCSCPVCIDRREGGKLYYSYFCIKEVA